MFELTARRRRALAAGVLVLALGAAAVSTNLTGAWFTSSVTAPATVTGALLSIGEVGKTSDKTTIAVSDVYPMTDAQALANAATARARSEWITVRNTGTIPLDWSMQIVNPQAKAPLTAAQLAMFRFQLFSEAGAKLTAPMTLASQPAAAVPGGALTSAEALAAGAQSKVEIRVWLDTAAGNEFQGAGASFDVVLNAIQGEAPRPVGVPVGLSALTVTPVSAGTPSGTSTTVDWSDAGAQLSARGYTSAPTYTVQRSATGDFSDATTVYTGPNLRADDTVGTATPTGNRDATQITATSRQDATFALIGGKVYAWGSIYQTDKRSAGNYWFQTGKALEITGFPGAVTQMSAGRDHFCAVIETGQVYCAGFNGSGQLGNGSTSNALSGAVAVSDENGVFTGKRIVQVDAGEYFTCALASDGTVGCWGDNSHKQLGSSTAGSTSNVPVAVNGTGSSTPATVLGSAPVKISAGGSFACVLAPTSATAGKSAACWGEGGSGQLGAATSSDSVTPVLVKDSAGLLVGASQISTASGTACVITNATTAANVVCWGLNDRSLLGDGGTTNSSIPARIGTSATGFEFLELGTSVACAGKASAIYCWGDDWAGQLGRGVTTDANFKPAAITDTNKALNGTSYTAVAAGWTHACAINAAGAVACWGLSHQFQLGNNDTGADGDGRVNGDWSTNVPVQVKLAGTNLDGTSSSLVCPAGAPKLSDTTCGLSPQVAYSYRLGYTSPDIADWASDPVTAVRR